MNRTLIAGARTPRGESPAALMKRENQTLAQLYGCLGDLFLLAKQARKRITANARLEPKLNDPALQQHPKRPEYLELFWQRDLEIRVIRTRAEPFQREFAAIWPRLSPETQTTIRSEPGWPDVTAPALLARRVFEWYAGDGWWLGLHEAPFVLVGVVVLAQIGGIA